jgi:hypothetical protein
VRHKNARTSAIRGIEQLMHLFGFVLYFYYGRHKNADTYPMVRRPFGGLCSLFARVPGHGCKRRAWHVDRIAAWAARVRHLRCFGHQRSGCIGPQQRHGPIRLSIAMPVLLRRSAMRCSPDDGRRRKGLPRIRGTRCCHGTLCQRQPPGRPWSASPHDG